VEKKKRLFAKEKRKETRELVKGRRTGCREHSPSPYIFPFLFLSTRMSHQKKKKGEKKRKKRDHDIGKKGASPFFFLTSFGPHGRNGQKMKKKKKKKGGKYTSPKAFQKEGKKREKC